MHGLITQGRSATVAQMASAAANLIEKAAAALLTPQSPPLPQTRFLILKLASVINRFACPAIKEEDEAKMRCLSLSKLEELETYRLGLQPVNKVL